VPFVVHFRTVSEIGKDRMMNLYLTQAKTQGYDVYSSAVVVAKSSLAARKIHPSGDNENFNDDDPIGNYTWVNWEDVTATRIGQLFPHSKYKEGDVICASFHAG
jgi:hypothetical protein